MDRSSIHVVTGGAGFIGRHLLDRLVRLGINGITVDRREGLDCNNRCKVERVLAQAEYPEVLWHLAANSDIEAGSLNPNFDIRDTFLSTANAIKWCRRIVFASSSAVYGEESGRLKEDCSRTLPISNYGAMKLASENLIWVACQTTLKRAIVLRFPNVVGPGMTHGVIRDLVLKVKDNPNELEVLGDGNQRKSYMHVSELIDAMLYVYEHSVDGYQCYNVAPDTTTTVKYIARGVVKAMKSKTTIQYGVTDRGWVGDVPRVRMDSSKLKWLGWSAKLTSNQAVDRAIAECVAELA